MRLERELPVSPEAASEARHALDDIGDELPGGRLRDVRLLVSELVTNAVRHANLADGDIILLVVEVADDALRVEVHDPGGGFVPSAPSPTPRGRRAGACTSSPSWPTAGASTPTSARSSGSSWTGRRPPRSQPVVCGTSA